MAGGDLSGCQAGIPGVTGDNLIFQLTFERSRCALVRSTLLLAGWALWASFAGHRRSPFGDSLVGCAGTARARQSAESGADSVCYTCRGCSVSAAAEPRFPGDSSPAGSLLRRPGSSVVERGPEKAGVGGSIPSLATITTTSAFVAQRCFPVRAPCGRLAHGQDFACGLGRPQTAQVRSRPWPPLRINKLEDCRSLRFGLQPILAIWHARAVTRAI